MVGRYPGAGGTELADAGFTFQRGPGGNVHPGLRAEQLRRPGRERMGDGHPPAQQRLRGVSDLDGDDDTKSIALFDCKETGTRDCVAVGTF